jgi:hypothetical protein
MKIDVPFNATAISSLLEHIILCRVSSWALQFGSDQTVDTVHIFNDKMQQISVHSKANQGFRSTDQIHISPRKRSLAELGVDALINRCQRLGHSCGAWAYADIQNRGPEAVRTLQGLIYLAREHPIAELEHATHTALQHGRFRFKDIRSLLKNKST